MIIKRISKIGGVVEKMTEEKTVELLEGHGYYRSGTVLELLKNGECLQSCFAYFEKE